MASGVASSGSDSGPLGLLAGHFGHEQTILGLIFLTDSPAVAGGAVTW